MANNFRNVDGTTTRWKPPVATSADLPASGNTEGDVRIAKDTGAIYAWIADAWQLEQDPSGTVNPGGNDTNVQYNNAGAFAGDDTFTWNSAATALSLGNAAGSTTYAPSGSSATINTSNVDAALVVRSEDSEPVEGAFGTYGGPGIKQVFVGSVTDHPVALYTNNTSIHVVTGTGAQGHETHVVGDESSSSSLRNSTGATLSVFTPLNEELTHSQKWLDESDNVTASIDVDGNASFASIEYTPTTAGDWSPAPTTIEEALDQLAARVKALEDA
jgi:hypothetical protein